MLVALTGTVFYTEAGPAAAQTGRFSADFPVAASTGPEAQELLGLARERNGQLAQATAEYQEYLRQSADQGGLISQLPAASWLQD